MKKLYFGALLMLAVALPVMSGMASEQNRAELPERTYICRYPSAETVRRDQEIKAKSAECSKEETMTDKALQWTKGEIVEVGSDYLVIKGRGTYDLVKVMLNKGSKASVRPSAELEGEGKHIGLKLGLNTPTAKGGTLLADGSNGRPLYLKSFKVGAEVVAYYGPKASRSYPPQVEGEAVILCSKPDKLAKYYVVDSVENAADGKYVTVFNASHDLYATIQGKACRDYREIKPGTKLLLWSDIMTMSIPARTNATRVKIIE